MLARLAAASLLAMLREKAPITPERGIDVAGALLPTTSGLRARRRTATWFKRC